MDDGPRVSRSSGIAEALRGAGVYLHGLPATERRFATLAAEGRPG